MSRSVVVACVVGMLMTACGGGDDGAESAGEALIGTWLLQPDNGFECIKGFTFGNDGRFEKDYICQLEGGGLGVDAIVGQYEVQDARIGLSATHATCAGVSKSMEWAGFTFLQDQKQLRIVTDSGALVLVRREDDGAGGGTGSAAFGCFDDELAFEPRKLTAL